MSGKRPTIAELTAEVADLRAKLAAAAPSPSPITVPAWHADLQSSDCPVAVFVHEYEPDGAHGHTWRAQLQLALDAAYSAGLVAGAER
jgi:hypothetical protein